MPTKATLKLVKSLQHKKYRKEYKLFVVEGIKSVNEFLNSNFNLKYLFAQDESKIKYPKAELCSRQEMQQLSGLKTAPPVLAVFEQKQWTFPIRLDSIIIALDNIQDPGNLGTIIRLADWFGINDILCNTETVEVYNPKVVQACMGSLTRVGVHYINLADYLQKQNQPIFGTFMDGENIYTQELPSKGIIVLGNEAHGISHEIEQLCSNRIAIPQAGHTTESLNVAIATGITLSEFFRRKF